MFTFFAAFGLKLGDDQRDGMGIEFVSSSRKRRERCRAVAVLHALGGKPAPQVLVLSELVFDVGIHSSELLHVQCSHVASSVCSSACGNLDDGAVQDDRSGIQLEKCFQNIASEHGPHLLVGSGEAGLRDADCILSSERQLQSCSSSGKVEDLLDTTTYIAVVNACENPVDEAVRDEVGQQLWDAACSIEILLQRADDHVASYACSWFDDLVASNDCSSCSSPCSSDKADDFPNAAMFFPVGCTCGNHADEDVQRLKCSDCSSGKIDDLPNTPMHIAAVSACENHDATCSFEILMQRADDHVASNVCNRSGFDDLVASNACSSSSLCSSGKVVDLHNSITSFAVVSACGNHVDGDSACENHDASCSIEILLQRADDHVASNVCNRSGFDGRVASNDCSSSSLCSGGKVVDLQNSITSIAVVSACGKHVDGDGQRLLAGSNLSSCSGKIDDLQTAITCVAVVSACENHDDEDVASGVSSGGRSSPLLHPTGGFVSHYLDVGINFGESPDLLRLRRACARVGFLVPGCAYLVGKCQQAQEECWRKEEFLEWCVEQLFDTTDDSTDVKFALDFVDKIWGCDDDGFLPSWKDA